MSSKITRNWSSPWLCLLYSPKDIFYVPCILVWALSLPIIAMLSVPIYIIAWILSYLLPNYGKFINYFDAWMEEDFVNSIPRNSVVTTLLIEGDLTVEELRSLFKTNVLEAPSIKNPKRVRYPELKQYLTRILGFGIWKNDDNFLIENHIMEGSHLEYGNNNNENNIKCYESILANIHQELLNLPYQQHLSPWQIILIRNFTPDSCLLACRTHHVLADAKSQLKLFVECLGGKELKTASPQKLGESYLDKFTFYPLFLPKYLGISISTAYTFFKCHFHPWKVPFYWNDDKIKTVLEFTPKLALGHFKRVAKSNGVTSSSVVMSIVAGGIRRLRKNLGDGEVTIGYTLPKPEHPEFLTNHVYMGFLELPTDQADVHNRLKLCNENFMKVKSSQQGRYLDFFTLMGGSQIFPFTRFAVNQFAPTGITNIAGEEEGFSVGSRNVKDFQMSVGTLGGVAGVVFCVFSYTDGIRIAVVAKENILEKEEAKTLVKHIFQEFKALMVI